MSLTYERPSAPALNGRSPGSPASGFSTSAVSPGGSSGRGAGYSADEIAVRTGVPRAVLAVYAAIDCAAVDHTAIDYIDYTAIDVVRLAVMERLMRSGVPVARAAALVQAAETLARAAI